MFFVCSHHQMTVQILQINPATIKSKIPLQQFGGLVPAGFPSPAEDWLEDPLDLNELLVTNPPATFLMRVTGDSMKGVGILDGSILVIDRSITPKSGMIVVAALNGELTVKMYAVANKKPCLIPANPDYPEIPVTEDTLIWGVVKAAIHRF